MRESEVRVGEIYAITASKRKVPFRLEGMDPPVGTNLFTGRKLELNSCKRLLYPLYPPVRILKCKYCGSDVKCSRRGTGTYDVEKNKIDYRYVPDVYCQCEEAISARRKRGELK